MRIPEYKRSEVEIEQGRNGFEATKWWQARDKDGLVAETSTRDDFEQLNLIGQEGVTFHRLYEKREAKWVQEHPFPDVVEWRVILEFPKYEMTSHGEIRNVEKHDRPQPVFIGDEGDVGYQLHRGLGIHLKGINQLIAEVFPELVDQNKKEKE
jgi:hypothetical protein